MSEDKMIGMIDAKYRKRVEKKKREWGQKEHRSNADGSVQGYEEYIYPVIIADKVVNLRGAVRWWRK